MLVPVVMEVSRRAFLSGLMTGLGQVMLPAPGRRLEPTLFRVNVPVRGLPRTLDGLRIGQVSDTHIGAVLGVDHLRRALDLLRRDPPEILVATGDLVDDAGLARPCLDELASIRAGLGRFYILGNHENYAGRERIIDEAMRHPHVRLLLDAGHLVHEGGIRVHVAGLDYPREEDTRVAFHASPLPHVVIQRIQPRLPERLRAASQAADEGDFRLRLVHHPDAWTAMAGDAAELTLSGHTHGGQVAPLGTMLAHSAFAYVLGMYERPGQHLYVNGGTGHWLPLRSVPAEVTLLTLRRV
ncbi:MAG: metallophosphoesterase [Deltaproteobacteria bacterium]|nr:metallophosphoesterase [Deltaproteobacteria bacterium]